MFVVSRKDIPAISSIMVNGELYDLGLLKDLRKHSKLANFLPDTARVSISWTRLLKNEVLAIHQHPTLSIIIITEGKGRTMGDCHENVQAGDIIVVPVNAKHGFVGEGKKGFWALSLQFEGLGLYEDTSNPRVNFLKNGNVS